MKVTIHEINILYSLVIAIFYNKTLVFSIHFYTFFIFPISAWQYAQLAEESISRYRQIALEFFHFICYTYEIVSIAQI